jgi:hypothetical protein
LARRCASLNIGRFRLVPHRSYASDFFPNAAADFETGGIAFAYYSDMTISDDLRYTLRRLRGRPAGNGGAQS